MENDNGTELAVGELNDAVKSESDTVVSRVSPIIKPEWHAVCGEDDINCRWESTTYVMELPTGCLVRVATIASEDHVTVAESITFVPNIRLRDFGK